MPKTGFQIILIVLPLLGFVAIGLLANDRVKDQEERTERPEHVSAEEPAFDEFSRISKVEAELIAHSWGEQTNAGRSTDLDESRKALIQVMAELGIEDLSQVPPSRRHASEDELVRFARFFEARERFDLETFKEAEPWEGRATEEGLDLMKQDYIPNVQSR